MQFRGTTQPLHYVWRGRKPLFLGETPIVQPGDTFQPTVEMVVAFQDVMTAVGESLRVAPSAEGNLSGEALPSTTTRVTSRGRKDDTGEGAENG